MDYTQYIKPELFVLVLALVGFGAVLKQLKAIKDCFIPLILMGIGVFMACLYILGTEGINPTSIFTAIIQGILCAATAVFGHQLVKQAQKGE